MVTLLEQNYYLHKPEDIESKGRHGNENQHSQVAICELVAVLF